MLIKFTFSQYKNYRQQLYGKNTNDLLYNFYPNVHACDKGYLYETV